MVRLHKLNRVSLCWEAAVTWCRQQVPGVGSTHTHTHTYIHAHTHTHTHTHTHMATWCRQQGAPAPPLRPQSALPAPAPRLNFTGRPLCVLREREREREREKEVDEERHRPALLSKGFRCRQRGAPAPPLRLQSALPAPAPTFNFIRRPSWIGRPSCVL